MATGPSVAGTSGASSRDRRHGRRCAAIESVLANGVVQLGRLAERRDAELAIEDRDELAVLPDRPDPIAGERQQLDEPPVAELVERVQLDATAGRLDGPGGVAGGGLGPSPAGRAASPTERSTRTARPACQSSNAGLSRSAKPARNGPRARAAAASRSAGRAEAARRSSSARSTLAAVGSSATCVRPMSKPAGPTADRSADSVRRRAPRAASSSAVRPEHRGQLVARERPALGRDEGDDRQRLAGIDDDRLTRHHDLERAKQADLQRHGLSGHGVTVLDGHGIP